MSAPLRKSRTRSKPSSGSSGSAFTNVTKPDPTLSTSAQPDPPDTPNTISVERHWASQSPKSTINMSINANIDEIPTSGGMLEESSHNGVAASPIGDVDDDRSSSLSEIDETQDAEGLDSGIASPAIASIEGESEAETERLEKTPQKLRKAQNVILGDLEDTNGSKALSIQSGNEVIGLEELLHEGENLEDHEKTTRSALKDDDGVQEEDEEEDESGLLSHHREDPSEDIPKASPPELAGRKRKRATPTSHDGTDDAEAEGPAPKRTASVREEEEVDTVESSEQKPEIEADGDLEMDEIDEENTVRVESINMLRDIEDERNIDNDSMQEEPLLSRKATKGKISRRKGRKAKSDPQERGQHQTAQTEEEETNNTGEQDNGDGEGEDAGEADAPVDADEAEAAAKNEEELLRKRNAWESLSTIEQHFATFRDKLYDERLSQLTEELSLLQQPNPTHPEYLAMLRCLDVRRDEKIRLEQTTLAYKLAALQRKGVAERSQLHSQYYQTVREIRDKTLQEIGEQWYQIQRDRRAWEGTVPEFTYKFPTRRSEQIKQQTAYNLEVSILSGIAKYVGFPAGPSLEGATTSEVDDDFQNMGIPRQPRQATTNTSTGSRTSVLPNSFTRPRHPAEEQFLEQTPWANPQHPAHQQQVQQIQRNAQQQTNTTSPFTTPAAQRRIVDLTAPNGSASTLGTISLPNSSAAATPVISGQIPNASHQPIDISPSGQPTFVNKMGTVGRQSDGQPSADSKPPLQHAFPDGQGLTRSLNPHAIKESSNHAFGLSSAGFKEEDHGGNPSAPAPTQDSSHGSLNPSIARGNPVRPLGAR